MGLGQYVAMKHRDLRWHDGARGVARE